MSIFNKIFKSKDRAKIDSRVDKIAESKRIISDKDKKIGDDKSEFIKKSEEIRTGKFVVKKDTQKANLVKVDKENAKEAYKVLIKPIISEKATDIGRLNQYIFEVNPKSNRVEVKKAIAALYGIVPSRVNMINMRGKRVRLGRFYGKRKNWKKAIVTLPKGQSIEIYEGT